MSQAYSQFIKAVLWEEEVRQSDLKAERINYEKSFADGALRNLHRRIVALEDALGAKENHGA